MLPEQLRFTTILDESTTVKNMLSELLNNVLTAVVLVLIVVVAVMGLSADSAAVVIGAMLLAPLMQPVLATAACIAMALFRKSL